MKFCLVGVNSVVLSFVELPESNVPSLFFQACSLTVLINCMDGSANLVLARNSYHNLFIDFVLFAFTEILIM